MKHYAVFHFYGEMCDFIYGCDSGVGRHYYVNGNPSVKDAIESQGPPHTEIALIKKNNQVIRLDYNLQESDEIEMFPIPYSLAEVAQVKLNIKPDGRTAVRRTAVILEEHLGKLAKIIRLLGLHTFYKNSYKDDGEIIDIAKKEKRIILTRDVGAVKAFSSEL